MKTGAAVLTLVTVLALPSVAAAKTYTLTGKFRSDAGTISLKVKTNKKGKPVSVSKIKAKNLRYRCPDPSLPENAPNPEGRRTVEVPGKLSVKYDQDVKGYIFRKSFKVDGSRVNSSVFGVVSKSGKRVKQGDLSVDFFQGPLQCANGIPGFTAKAK